MIDFTGKRKWYFTASGIVILIGVIFLIAFGMNRGIEFTGGSTMTVSFEQEVSQDDIRAEMMDLGYDEAIIQRTGGGDFIIRTALLSDAEVAQITAALAQRFGEEPNITDVYTVSGTIAGEIERDAFIAVLVAAIGILLYVTWAFRRIARSFRFGVCAIIALIHDVLFVLGLFSVLGVVFNIEIDAMFITGVLTVIGYSVNDTIVVFDRIRENRLKSPGTPLKATVNQSIMETLGRSLNTSLTTLFVLLALLLLGGATIQNFILVLLVGVIVGTYSSIGIASQLLVVWDEGTFGRFFRRVIPRRAPAGG